LLLLGVPSSKLNSTRVGYRGRKTNWEEFGHVIDAVLDDNPTRPIHAL